MNVLCLPAHPDDEALAAGGTIAKYASRVVIFGRGRGHNLDQLFDTVPLRDWADECRAALVVADPVDLLITHWTGDLNQDHQVIAQSALIAARGASIQHIWAMQPEFSLEPFAPTVFVDITAHWDAKVKALEQYASEMRPYPHPRSIKALEARARYWGTVAGCDMAEAFIGIRGIW